MCDAPVPCECTLERRAKLRSEHIERSERFSGLAYRLSVAGEITEEERDLLYAQSEREWDDAIHIASPDDLLRSLCGQYGRNLCDLPERPDGGSGCWTCLQRADELAPAHVEMATA
jgi:hypothetical protein